MQEYLYVLFIIIYQEPRKNRKYSINTVMEKVGGWARTVPVPAEASPAVAGEHASVKELRQGLCLSIFVFLVNVVLPGS